MPEVQNRLYDSLTSSPWYFSSGFGLGFAFPPDDAHWAPSCSPTPRVPSWAEVRAHSAALGKSDLSAQTTALMDETQPAVNASAGVSDGLGTRSPRWHKCDGHQARG